MKTAFTCLFAAVLLSGCNVTLPKLPDGGVIPPAITNVISDLPSVGTNQGAVATLPPALPFDRSRCTFKRIDPTTLEWQVTRTLTVTKVTSEKVWSSCTGPDWPKRSDGLQGCFALAVEQPDGDIVVGTFDYNRSKHQPMKGFDNLYTNSKGENEHRFFGITNGARCWVFTTASNRDGERTVKERTNLVPFTWEWEAPK